MVIRGCTSSLTSNDTSTRSPTNCDPGDRAHLDAGDAHRRALAEPGDVVEDRLQRIPLPREAAGAAQQEDQTWPP